MWNELGGVADVNERRRRPAPFAPRIVARPVSGLTSCHGVWRHCHLPKPKGSVVIRFIPSGRQCYGSITVAGAA
jgi:hypothetical protein